MYRVVRVSNGRYQVVVDGVVVDMIARKRFKSKDGILVGDWVEYSIQAGQAVIETVHLRVNSLIRPHVANIDGVIVVLSSVPTPDYLMVDKLSYNCAMQSIDLVVCVNKLDLVDADFLIGVQDRYKRVCRIVGTTALYDRVDELRAVLQGKLYALAGQSAVGKSSLINSLTNATQSIGDLSQKLQRGRHTTTGSRLFVIDQDSYLIDTPGFSMLDVVDIAPNQLSEYVVDFDQLRGLCKYSSCTHTVEPECAIMRGVASGDINASRYHNYTLIYNQLANKKRF
jgi:ribosome biogenesis GTPase